MANRTTSRRISRLTLAAALSLSGVVLLADVADASAAATASATTPPTKKPRKPKPPKDTTTETTLVAPVAPVSTQGFDGEAAGIVLLASGAGVLVSTARRRTSLA